MVLKLFFLISLLVSDFQKISVIVQSIPEARPCLRIPYFLKKDPPSSIVIPAVLMILGDRYLVSIYLVQPLNLR